MAKAALGGKAQKSAEERKDLPFTGMHPSTDQLRVESKRYQGRARQWEKSQEQEETLTKYWGVLQALL